MYIKLFLILCFGILSHGKEDPRLNDIGKLISQYKSKHSIQAVVNEANEKTEDFCKRQYVYDLLYCSSNSQSRQLGIGTIWGTNLANNFAMALLLDRTLVVDFNSADCEGLIDLGDWVVSHKFIKNLTSTYNCPLLEATPLEPLNNCFQCKLNNPTINDMKFIRFDPWYWQSVYYLFHPHNDGQLNPLQREKFDILYSNPISSTPYEAAGLLISNIISFTSNLKKLVNSIMDPLGKSEYVTISMHLRHQDGNAWRGTSLSTNKYAEFDEKFVKCFNDIRQRFPNKKCVLYIASDRPQSVKHVTQHAAVKDCDLRTAPRAVVNSTGEFNGEHGPWSGATSILDVYVLAHTDWFIGSRGSSYSLLINNLVMLNSVKKGRSDNPLYEVTMGAEGCKEVLPATASDNAYRNNPGICSSAKCAGK